MKTTSLHSAWQRITAAARKAPPEESLRAPYGFSARIVSLSHGRVKYSPNPLTEITWKPLFITSIIMIAVIGFNFSATTAVADNFVLDDPIGDLLDLN